MSVFVKKMMSVVLLLFVSQMSVAGNVQQNYKGLTLNGNLELASGKVLGESIILITHGTLAHGKMEITSTLQGLFKENELDSLSITLGLGQSDRKGMYDCKSKHTHKHTDALDEIGVWVNWLKKKGVKNITLLGHSRGGNQTAWYAAERADAAIKKVVLIAPMAEAEGYAAQSYKKRYKKDLAPILAKAEALVNKGKGQTVMTHTDHIYCTDTSVTAESFVSYNKTESRFNTPVLLAKIKAPVLVFVGSKDKVAKDLDKKVMPYVKKGKVELNVIDGAGHMFRDLYADDVVEAIIDFL